MYFKHRPWTGLNFEAITKTPNLRKLEKKENSRKMIMKRDKCFGFSGLVLKGFLPKL